jgi:hypothetical protein
MKGKSVTKSSTINQKILLTVKSNVKAGPPLSIIPR